MCLVWPPALPSLTISPTVRIHNIVCVCVHVCVSEWVGVCSKSNIVGTSKAGMDMATKVMALELGRHQVSFSLSKELSSW